MPKRKCRKLSRIDKKTKQKKKHVFQIINPTIQNKTPCHEIRKWTNIKVRTGDGLCEGVTEFETTMADQSKCMKWHTLATEYHNTATQTKMRQNRIKKPT